MSLRLRRLNMDTSWEIHWDEVKMVLDPWLVGSEVDYFSWFNEQWHTTEAISPKSIEHPDFILISQSYSDHCHEETLDRFSPEIPVLASPKAYKRLSKHLDDNRLIQLPIMSKDGFLEYKGLKIATIDPGRWMDPVYYAHIIIKDKEAIFYSSHGFKLNPRQLEILELLDIKVLITSFSEIRLPSFLGGKVNPGIENVESLIYQLNPKYTANSHDEQKKHRGIVMKMAQTVYPNISNLQLQGTELLNIDDYSYMTIK